MSQQNLEESFSASYNKTTTAPSAEDFALLEKEIMEADAAKKAETEQLAEKQKAANQAGKDYAAATDLLIAESAEFTEAQKKAVTAKAAEENQSLDSILAAKAAQADNLAELKERTAFAKQLQEDAMKDAYAASQRQKGLKQNAEGQWVEMSTLEKVGYGIQQTFAYDSDRDSVIEQSQTTQASQYGQMAVQLQVEHANLLNQITNEAQYDEDYIKTKQLATDAIALAEIEKLDLQQQNVVFEGLATKYGVAQDSFKSFAAVAQNYDESERPRLLLQLMGLKQQGESLRLAGASAQKDDEVFRAAEAKYLSAMEVKGKEINDVVKNNAKIFANFIVKGDVQGMAYLANEDPAAISEMADLWGKQLTTDMLGEMSPSDIQLFESEDPQITAYQVMHEAGFELAMDTLKSDSKWLEDQGKLLQEQGLEANSEEYTQALQQVMINEAHSRAKAGIADFQNNSIDAARGEDKLQPAKSSVGALLSASLNDPDSPYKGPIIKEMQTFATFLDDNMEQFSSDPSRFIENYLNQVKKGKLHDTTLNLMSDSDLQLVAQGMAETFSAVNQMTGTVQKQENALYVPKGDWILNSKDAKGPLKSARGKSLTDPNTFLFILRAEKSVVAPMGFGRVSF